MSQPERSPDHSRKETPSAESPPTPTPLQQAESGSADPHGAAVIVRLSQARYEREQRCLTLCAERLRIFSECLATPIRPARDAWFAAWRLVADGTASGDLDAVVGGLEAAAKAFAAMDSVVTQWFARAQEWHRRARPIHGGFNGLIGFDTLETFADWDAEASACLPAFLANKQDFLDWAVAVEGMQTLRSIHGQMWGHHNSLYAVPDDCLELLRLVMAAPTGGEIRAFLNAKRGGRWLIGLAGVMAVTVGPLLPYDVFRPADLPTDDRQRNVARYLSNLTVHTFGHVGQGVQFRQKYFPMPPSPPSPRIEWDDAGADSLDSSETEPADAAPAPQDRPATTVVSPVWDAISRTLTIGAWKKQAALQAKNVISVLGQFQRSKWSTSSITPEVRADLDDLRKSLNDWLGMDPPITFSRDGTGKGIQWGIPT